MNLRVKVGSSNPVKVNAVKKAFGKYFKGVKVQGAAVDSGVREQPLTLFQILQGAKNRAKNTFCDCDYSVGIESGIMKFPSNSGFMEITIAVIFDGKNYFTGQALYLNTQKTL